MRNEFEDVVGQESAKATLELYIDAYKETERLPFILAISQRGAGKSFLVRKFREGLRRKDGSRPPILEVNAATIKNSKQFLEVVYPTWVNNNAFLFLDEAAELPHDLQSLLLTILEVKKDPIRNI
jgi:transcriptional regulator with AAA-type ATPase domain